jgi:hypothetical protein
LFEATFENTFKFIARAGMFCVVCLENFAPSETESMFRQVTHKVIAWLFAKRDFQGARDFLSRLLLPLWPTYEFAELGNITSPAGAVHPGASTDQCGLSRLQKTDAALDINPGSGEAFFRGRRPGNAANRACRNGLGPVDLFCHLLPTRIRRGRVLVLYSGSSNDIASFVGELLPRFFALDEPDTPKDLLLLVGLQMAKQRYFQDALIDQVFQPRPIEILRPFHVVSPKTLYTMSVRSWDAGLLDRAAARCAEIYGPYPEQNQPILLCTGGEARAARLAKKFAGLAPDFFSESFSVIDPHITPLKTCLHAIGRAPLVVAPNTGEAAILALAPSKKRIFYELREARSSDVIPPALMDTINASRKIIRTA